MHRCRPAVSRRLEPVRRSRRRAQEVYDQLSPVYDLLEGPFERRGRRTGRALLAVTAGERVLEIGCGTGADLAAMSEAVGPTGWCVGLDLSAGMLQRTRRRLARDEPGNVALVQADALRLPLAAGSFDVVYLSFTLELFDTDELVPVLDGCRRLLRATGRLGVVSLAQTTPPTAMERLYVRARRVVPSLLDCRPIPTAVLLRHAGFTIRTRRQLSVWGLPVDVVIADPQS